MILPRHPRYLIILYSLGSAKTIIVWDIEKDIEHTNFFSKSDDDFIDYFTSAKSKLGFVAFDQYIVDLDISVPIPFMSKKYPVDQRYWAQGVRINSKEDVILSCGTLITPLCYKDIYYYKNKTLTNLDFQKVTYYMNKKSVAFDYIDSYDSLKKVMDIFQDNPYYYVMLVLEDSKGKSPLQMAIENNASRIIELMLNFLLKLDHFSLSRKIYTDFPALFSKNLKSFERYLNSCYFVTEQMNGINKLEISASVDTIRDHYGCSILDAEFYKKYGVRDKDGKVLFAKDDKNVKGNQVAPSERPDSKAIDRQSSAGDAADLLDNDILNVFEEEENLLKRVSIKGIEFDWIFQGKHANNFLSSLCPDEENIEIFSQDIIRDIILFQWKYFKSAIILKLFIPYVIYFIIFCMFSTWLVEREFTENKDNGTYDVVNLIVGIIILLFNMFWLYVE